MKGCRSTISRSHILLVTKRFWVDVLRNASPRNDALSAGCVASASTATTDLSGRRARHWQTDRSDSPCRAGVRRLGKGQAPRRGLRPILLVDALVLGSGNPTPRQLSDPPSAPHAGKPEPSGPVPATQGSSEARTMGSWRPYTWGGGLRRDSGCPRPPAVSSIPTRRSYGLETVVKPLHALRAVAPSSQPTRPQPGPCAFRGAGGCVAAPPPTGQPLAAPPLEAAPSVRLQVPLTGPSPRLLSPQGP